MDQVKVIGADTDTDIPALQTALEQSNLLIKTITYDLPYLMIIVEDGTDRVHYANYEASLVLSENRDFVRHMVRSLRGEAKRLKAGCAVEFSTSTADAKQYYTVNAYPVLWQCARSTAFMLHKVSKKKDAEEDKQPLDKDRLTRVYNRLSGMMILNKWLDGKRKFILCLADLDNIRYINYTYGRDEGDRFIVYAAERLQQFSPDAVVIRAGGDEFMILIPDMEEAGVRERLEEIGLELQRSTADKPYYYSMSYGIAVVDGASTLSASEILSIADQRMQEDKLLNKKKRMLTSDETTEA